MDEPVGIVALHLLAGLLAHGHDGDLLALAQQLFGALAGLYYWLPHLTGRLSIHRLSIPAFWLIFLTLMLPVEVRLIPTFQVMVDLRLTDTMTGLTLPLIASATATLLFRQFFLTIPDELTEAARIDGAGPMKFFRDILLPLSRTNIAALFVILFIYGWNQYLWPLLIVLFSSLLPGERLRAHGFVSGRLV